MDPMQLPDPNSEGFGEQTILDFISNNFSGAQALQLENAIKGSTPTIDEKKTFADKDAADAWLEEQKPGPIASGSCVTESSFDVDADGCEHTFLSEVCTEGGVTTYIFFASVHCPCGPTCWSVMSLEYQGSY